MTSEKGLLSQNSAQVHKLDLSVRIARPSVHLSGTYTCKVATFFDEQKSTHSVIIYGKNIIVFWRISVNFCSSCKKEIVKKL